MKSKVISISAIATVLVALCLVIGAYFEIFELVGVVLSSVFVILPLYYKSYKGCFLCYLAGGVVGFIAGSFNIFSIVFSIYFLFFGIFPILKNITENKINKILYYILGIVWTIAVFYFIFFFYTYILKLSFDDLPAWLIQNIMYFIPIFGAVFFLIYNRFLTVVKIFLDRFLNKIIK